MSKTQAVKIASLLFILILGACNGDNKVDVSQSETTSPVESNSVATSNPEQTAPDVSNGASKSEGPETTSAPYHNSETRSTNNNPTNPFGTVENSQREKDTGPSLGTNIEESSSDNQSNTKSDSPPDHLADYTDETPVLGNKTGTNTVNPDKGQTPTNTPDVAVSDPTSNQTNDKQSTPQSSNRVIDFFAQGNGDQILTPPLDQTGIKTLPAQNSNQTSDVISKGNVDQNYTRPLDQTGINLLPPQSGNNTGITVFAGLTNIDLQNVITRTLPVIATFKIREDQGIARENEPVTQGFPFAQGAVRDPSLLVVTDDQGNGIATQVQALGIRWPDASVKWALLNFPASIEANSEKTYQIRYGQAGPSPYGAIQIQNTGSELLVKTGVLQASFAVQNGMIASGSFFPNKIWSSDSGNYNSESVILSEAPTLRIQGDRQAMTAQQMLASGKSFEDLSTFGLLDQRGTPWGQIQRNIDYSRYMQCPCRVDIEEQGLNRSVIRVAPTRSPAEGELGFVARFYFYAGKKQMRTELSLVNYENSPVVQKPGTQEFYVINNTKHIRDYSISFRPRLGTLDSIYLGNGDEAMHFPVNQSHTFLQNNAQDFNADGQSVSGKMPGWMSLHSATKHMNVSNQFFWQNYPKGFEFNQAGVVKLNLWPVASGKTYPLTPGRQKTYEFLLDFENQPLASSAQIRASLKASFDISYLNSTRALESVIGLNDSSFSSLERFWSNGKVRRLSPRQGLWFYGDIDFGDQGGFGRAADRFNGYHGVSNEMIFQYLASGKTEDFRLAEAAVDHTFDVDTVHWGENFTGAREVENARPEDHTSHYQHKGSIKLWNEGEVNYYLLTGKRRFLESFERNINFVLDGTGGMSEGNYAAARATSLPLIHVIKMGEVVLNENALKHKFPQQYTATYPQRSDALSQERSEYIIDKLVNAGNFLSQSIGNRSHVKSAFQFAYTVDALFRLGELSGQQSYKQKVIEATQWFLSEMTLPTGMPIYDASATGSNLASASLPYVHEVDRIYLRAYQVSRDKNYLMKAAPIVDWRLSYMQQPYILNGHDTYLNALLANMKAEGISEQQLKVAMDTNAPAFVNFKAYLESKRNGSDPNREDYCTPAYEVSRAYINNGQFDLANQWLSAWKSTPEGCVRTNGFGSSLESFQLSARRNPMNMRLIN